MSKYGNINIPIPDFTMELAALSDLLEKGEISEKEYSDKKEQYRKLKLSFIVATNGGKKAPKAKAQKKTSIVDRRDAFYANKALSIRERLLQQETTVEDVEAETTQNIPPA